MGKNCRTSFVCVAIGDSAIANYYRNVAIGKNVTANKASASIAIGNNVVSTGATSWAGGHNITASGHFSTALGSNASTNFSKGSFVYGDHSTPDTVKNTAPDQFVIRADSGFVFYTTSDLSMSVTLNNGDGSWNSVSDVSKKENITELNSLKITTSVLNIPVYTWNYKNQNNQHIGPMAQDFNSFFNVGELSNYINMSDIDGVILSGIKNTNQKLDEETKDKEVIVLEEEIDTEQEKLHELEQKIKLLYEKLDH